MTQTGPAAALPDVRSRHAVAGLPDHAESQTKWWIWKHRAKSSADKPAAESAAPGRPADSPPAGSATQSDRASGSAASGSATPDIPILSDGPRPPQHWWQKKWVRVAGMTLLLVIALIIVYRSIKPAEFESAIKQMSPWWFVAAFFVAMLAWVGSAITIKVYSPVDIKYRGALFTEIAASFVGVVAPAGLGPLALETRFLVKQGATSSQAIATMMLAEISKFLTSIVLVIGALLFAGINPDVKIPWDKIGWVVLALVVVLAIAASIRVAREWALKEITQIWQKFAPRVKWVLQHPKDLAIAVAGSLIQTGAYVAAFVFALNAFGQHVDWWKVAAIYLIFNTLGSAIPVPGGVGSIEAALTAGLALINVPAAVGLSAAITFRLATFYTEIPIGWVAFQYISKKKWI